MILHSQRNDAMIDEQRPSLSAIMKDDSGWVACIMSRIRSMPVRWAALALCVFFFLTFVWPSLHYHEKVGSGQYQRVYRVNRLTGGARQIIPPPVSKKPASKPVNSQPRWEKCPIINHKGSVLERYKRMYGDTWRKEEGLDKTE